jgi:hypothetical protein
VSEPCVPGYRILRPLGVGGMASVYLAVQESLDRKVALKIMAPALAANEVFAGRFLKEGRITAQLSHPHLVTVFDFGQQGSTYYLATEFIPGGSLRDKLDQGISVAESLDVVCDVALGLQFAHAAGFVHRDVKPGNVLFRLDGTAVLADFGIARSMDGKARVTQIGNTIGTPHYMSPEQVRGDEVDGRSDLYSLGVMLFELLTGKPPYDADDPFAIALMHVTHPLPQLPPALAWLQPLIDGLMAKDFTMRFAGGDDFVAAVEHLLAQAPDGLALRNAPETRKRAASRLSLTDRQPAALSRAASQAQPVSPRAVSEPTSPGPWTPRRRMVIAAIAAVLAVLGGAAAWKAVFPRADRETARFDEVCRAAAATVNAALAAADLTRAEAEFAAIPTHCGALDTQARMDRFAIDLPELRKRLDQAQYKATDDQNTTAEPGLPASPPVSRPHSDGSTAVKRPGTNASAQQSQKCRDISLRAGLGEETAEDRRYISENCR